jgi:hypothetical protein
MMKPKVFIIISSGIGILYHKEMNFISLEIPLFYKEPELFFSVSPDIEDKIEMFDIKQIDYFQEFMLKRSKEFEDRIIAEEMLKISSSFSHYFPDDPNERYNKSQNIHRQKHLNKKMNKFHKHGNYRRKN